MLQALVQLSTSVVACPDVSGSHISAFNDFAEHCQLSIVNCQLPLNLELVDHPFTIHYSQFTIHHSRLTTHVS